jgi:D-glycero-alpha-D-manno-heptose-7-phosphate kinase
MIKARAWCRVDFAGGTLDIWPLGLLHAGSRTVNVAVDLAVTAAMARRSAGFVVLQGGNRIEVANRHELLGDPRTALIGVIAAALDLPGFSAELTSASPQGAGLGASSAMAVALLAAAEEEFDLARSNTAGLAHLARDLEARLMGLPTGLQDHYAALLGGALEIVPVAGGERVRSLALDLEALAARLVVVYSGRSHFSAGENWRVVRQRLDGDDRSRALMDQIARISGEMVRALEAEDFAAAGRLLGEEWSYRRQLAPGVSVPVLERLLAAAIAAGAWGGKACGAGGGGCLAVLAPPERRAEITLQLARAGGTVLDAHPTTGVLRVERLEEPAPRL